MKNIKVLLLALTVSLFASCEDAIDITQPSELSPERAFETVEDMQLGLNAVYGSVPGENMILFTSVFTDEIALGRANGGQGQDGSLAFLLNSNSGDAAGIWSSNYYMINLATRLIIAADNVEVEEGSQEETDKNDILAQAHALRAFGHLQLLTYFSPDMTDDSELGVIALDFIPELTSELPRNTNGEVYELIESDLAFAEANVVDVSPVADRFFVSQNFITAFRARMAAYRGQYELAKTYVDELDAVYNLANKVAYQAMFQDFETGANSEVIFKLDKTVTGQTGNFSQFWSSVNSTVNGSPFFEVNRALFNLVNNDDDVRKFVIVDPTALILEDYMSVSYADYLEQDVLPVGKYPGHDGQNLLNDIKVFRFSEMVLIRAEYFASLGNLAGVAGEINAIRSARYGSNAGNVAVPGNVTQAWGLILDERRAELAFEGHRYIDIKRLGTLAGKGVERDERDCSFNDFCDLPASDYRFTLPIPRAEIAANPNIQQNPEY